MSKLITTRFEYASYDDTTAQLAALPPTYPTVLDTYIADSIASAAQSYGVLNLSRADAGAANILAPTGATILLCAPSTNVQNVVVKSQSGAPVALTPGGATQTVFWTVQPGQIVTLPGVWNTSSSPLIVFAVDSTNAAANPTNATWNLQCLWSL